MHVRDASGNLVLDCTNSLTVTPPDGKAEVEILIPTSIPITKRPYQFDIEVTWPDGSIRSTETAYLKIDQDETYD
jgi:hypothetical protein